MCLHYYMAMERDHDKKSSEKPNEKLIQSNLVLYYSIRINIKIFIKRKKSLRIIDFLLSQWRKKELYKTQIQQTWPPL